MGRSRKFRLRSPAAECINTEKYDNERERVEKRKKGKKRGKKKEKKKGGKRRKRNRENRGGKHTRRYLIVRDSAAVLIRDMIDSNNNRGAAEARQGDMVKRERGGSAGDRLCSHLAVIEPDQFSITFALVNNRFVVHFGSNRRFTREIRRALPGFFSCFSFPLFLFFFSLFSSFLFVNLNAVCIL